MCQNIGGVGTHIYFSTGKTLTFLHYLRDSQLHAVQESVGNIFRFQIPTSEIIVSHNL